MSDDSRAIVPVSQHGVVASVGRRLEITEKLLAESHGKKEYTCPIMGAKFVLIPAGTFMMGSPEDEVGRDDDETLHQVTISKPFYLQTTQVTQRQWEMVMGNNPSCFTGENRPVQCVSWDDVQEFISELNTKSDKNYRLPTEAEWEYACRAGSNGRYCFGDNETLLGEYAWYYNNSIHETHPVGLKKPNAWGLYDMHGNVEEWCSDWYGEKYYSESPRDNPLGPGSSSYRLLRGGSWFYSAQESRAAFRDGDNPDERGNGFGFRVGVSVGRRLEITEKLLAESLGKKEYTCPIMGAKFVLIPAGTFMMGSPEDEVGRDDDETLHQVTISKPFYLQTTQVTQRQREMVMGNSPSEYKGEDRPVERVSWDDVQEYIQKLNELAGDARYRLPTEAEWEYAARSGGKSEKWAGTSNESSLGDYAWYGSNSEGKTHPVGQKKPNSLGIYDMIGNVWEYCSDWYEEKYYSESPRDNPLGPSSGSNRIRRGGSWFNPAFTARASDRGWGSGRHSNWGFRLVALRGQ